ncbi:TcmI family type II polyketide cyclase [Streptosporangium sp. KLBMP 9127]|nr:TcmI family type II polyketide cyclase [Streptosporangium sp. KLBMP 9127]
MHRTLIVARMKEHDAQAVADIFAESDAGELPAMLGGTGRTLFHFQGLYFHLVEAERDIGGNISAARNHPLYREVNDKLGEFISPYDPNWREPKDAMATPFYQWRA